MDLVTGLLVLLVALVLFEGWFILEGRPRSPKGPNTNHHHRGTIRSRHEQHGHEMCVYECEVCHLHFTGRQ